MVTGTGCNSTGPNLCLDVSVQDLPVVNVFESQADLDKPVKNLGTRDMPCT